MIPRYQDKNIEQIWSIENTTKKWLLIEMLVLEGWVKSGKISQKEFDYIKENIHINIDRWQEIEKETKHEFASFVKMLEETVNHKSSKWIHFGLTSSDVLDSVLMMHINETIRYISNILSDLFKTIDEKERLYGETEYCGRTHGKVAEKQSISDLLNRWRCELKRCLNRLNITEENLKIIKISGPVGNYSTITREIEFFVANKIGFKPALGSSQIISRDFIADYFYSLAMIASFLEKCATTIRILSMDGINEMYENFSKKQIGSSSMPHKRNPILSENISGLSRLIKSYLITAIDNNNSWLERDISHSSVERVIIQDVAHLTGHSIKNLIYVIENLIISSDNMLKNCNIFANELKSHTTLLNEITTPDSLSRFNLHEKISGYF
jgi:adenylosuccinate lyase